MNLIVNPFWSVSLPPGVPGSLKVQNMTGLIENEKDTDLMTMKVKAKTESIINSLIWWKLKVESAPFCILPWQLMRGKYIHTAQGIDFQQINL